MDADWLKDWSQDFANLDQRTGSDCKDWQRQYEAIANCSGLNKGSQIIHKILRSKIYFKIFNSLVRLNWVGRNRADYAVTGSTRSLYYWIRSRWCTGRIVVNNVLYTHLWIVLQKSRIIMYEAYEQILLINISINLII